MAKQRKLNTEIGTYNGVVGYTEHESFFLPEVTGGIKRLDVGHESIYEYELLDPLVENARNAFRKKVIKKIGELDYNKIRKGLKAYVRSSSSPSRKLKILKLSIIRAFGDDLLTRVYDSSDLESRQLIPEGYFEEINFKASIAENELIPIESIQFYQKEAVKTTVKYYSKFLRLVEEPIDIQDSILYAGFGNYDYYGPNRRKVGDVISVYGGLDEPTDFYQSSLLNSFSINDRLANHFMVMGNNNRRAMLNAELPCIIGDLFSSFFVSEEFQDGQYEFLMLPNRYPTFITERHSSDLLSDFTLRRKKHFFEEAFPTRDDLLNIADSDDE